MKPQSATEDPRCAHCDAVVAYIESAPARQTRDNNGFRRTPAWCRLEPCGHTFMIRGRGLIR